MRPDVQENSAGGGGAGTGAGARGGAGAKSSAWTVSASIHSPSHINILESDPQVRRATSVPLHHNVNMMRS